MAIENVEKQVCIIIGMMCDVEPDNLSRDSKFGEDVTVDSLNAMMINAALDEKYPHAPTYTEICNMHSIGEIVDSICALNP